MTVVEEYKVLARKYRPQKFKDLIGQDVLVEILTHAITNNRLAHAYILTGVRGVGKTTTARLIAMSINCKGRDRDISEPCGKCETCIYTFKDGNLDVIEMDAASNTGVDDVREIIENVKYKPINSKFKIFIIDEVHMLSKSAFNALLKTLEEPPEHVKFIFATTEVNKVPVTVLSRCQRFDLQRVNNKVLTEQLIKISEIEKIKITNDAISLIARAADGSVRDSLSLLDQAITEDSSEINSEKINTMLGLADKNKIFQLLDTVLYGKTSDALNQYKELYDLGCDVVMIFDELLNIIHFLTQLKIAPQLKDDILIPESERNQGLELAKKISINNLNIIWQILFKGYQELKTGIHLYQHGEMILLRIIFLKDEIPPDNLVNKIQHSNENEFTQNTSNSNNKNNSQDTSILSNTIDKDNPNHTLDKNSVSSFRKFVEMFYNNREGFYHSQLYNDVTLISFTDGEVILNTSKIQDSNFNRNIAKLISKWTGKIWQIHSSTSNIGKSLHEEDIIIQQKEIESTKNYPEIKSILNEYPKSKIHAITELTELNFNEDEVETKINKEI